MRWPILALAAILPAASSAIAQENVQAAPPAQETAPSASPDPSTGQNAPSLVGDALQSHDGPNCSGLPDHQLLSSTLRDIVAPGDRSANGGLGNHMWAVVVNREGQVCAVIHSGEETGDQWPGSRAIAAAKANTANGLSLPGFAISTANVYWPSQPGGSLYGLEKTNPADPAVIAAGPAEAWGTQDDPMIGQRAGGVVVFAGGLALYEAGGDLVGAIGLSGDESCTDHVIAWKMRHQLELDHVPDGVTKAGNDNIIFDIVDDPSLGRRDSASGYGHPECSARATTIAENFDETHPTGARPN